jgi:hypothetical protein
MRRASIASSVHSQADFSPRGNDVAPRVHHITNVNDDGTVPATSMWQQNFLDPQLNNFRQTQQGSVGAEAQADLTAELMADACVKPVGAGMPTAFFQGDPNDGVVLCVALTIDVLAPEMCETVACEFAGPLAGDVAVIANNDGMGGKAVNECIETNNDDSVSPIVCN